MQFVGQRDHRSRAKSCSASRYGFTLVELLVVIGIISVLISILLPALAKARQSAETVTCLAHLQQLGLGMTMYTNEYRGYPVMVPPNATYPYGLGWQDLICPYIRTLGFEQGYIYRGWAKAMHKLGFDDVKQSVYGCPADLNANGLSAWTSYSFNYNLVGLLGSPTIPVWRSAGRYRNADNLALLVCGGGTGYIEERIIYYQGTIAGTRMDCAAAWHNNGSTMLFCDGHAQRITVDTNDPIVYGGVFYGWLIDPQIRIYPDDNSYMPFPRPAY